MAVWDRRGLDLDSFHAVFEAVERWTDECNYSYQTVLWAFVGGDACCICEVVRSGVSRR